MSAYGTFSPTARPPRVLLTLWALPTPGVRHVAGGQENLLHPYHRALSPPTCKGQAASGCFASLDRSPAPSASVNVAMFTEVERGQGAAKPCILPLTPWSRPNTRHRVRWLGFNRLLAAPQVRLGFGQSPKVLT